MKDKSRLLLGVDLGGSKISFCYFNKSFELQNYSSVDTAELPLGKKDFFHEFEKLLVKYIHGDVKLIGLSVKGMVREGSIVYSPLAGGKVFYPAFTRLRKKYKVSVLVDNDVNCMARAENRFGYGRNCQSFVLINLGTGLRLSFYSDHLLISGYNNKLGEVTYERVFVPEFLHEVDLGKMVSGRGISMVYKEISGKDKPPRDIFTESERDPDCQKSVTIFTRYLSHLFSQISLFYNPQRIVINGSLKFSQERFLPEAIKLYRKETKRELICSGIFISRIDEAGALGSVLG